MGVSSGSVPRRLPGAPRRAAGTRHGEAARARAGGRVGVKAPRAPASWAGCRGEPAAPRHAAPHLSLGGRPSEAGRGQAVSTLSTANHSHRQGDRERRCGPANLSPHSGAQREEGTGARRGGEPALGTEALSPWPGVLTHAGLHVPCPPTARPQLCQVAGLGASGSSVGTSTLAPPRHPDSPRPLPPSSGHQRTRPTTSLTDPRPTRTLPLAPAAGRTARPATGHSRDRE